MLILSDAPTVANCVKYAKAFGRGYGSIEQIYRWAATPQKDIQGRRETDAFIEQIKRVSRLLGAGPNAHPFGGYRHGNVAGGNQIF